MLGWECSSVAVPAPAVPGRQTGKKSQIFLSGELQPHQWSHLDWMLLNSSANQVNYLCLLLGCAKLATSAQSVQWQLPWITELHNFFLLFLTDSAQARQKNWLQSHRKYVSPPGAQWKQLTFSSDYNRISHGFSFTMNNVFVKGYVTLKIVTCNNYFILGFFLQEDELVIKVILLYFYVMFYCLQHINDRWQLSLIILLQMKQSRMSFFFCLLVIFYSERKVQCPNGLVYWNLKHLCS